MMQVTVPPGAAAGQMMQVQLPAGQLVQVQVPAGLQPGQIFQMQVPAAGPVTAEQALAASIAAAGGELHLSKEQTILNAAGTVIATIEFRMGGGVGWPIVPISAAGSAGISASIVLPDGRIAATLLPKQGPAAGRILLCGSAGDSFGEVEARWAVGPLSLYITRDLRAGDQHVLSFVELSRPWVWPFVIGTCCLGAACVHCIATRPTFYVLKGKERVGEVKQPLPCSCDGGDDLLPRWSMQRVKSNGPAVLRAWLNYLAAETLHGLLFPDSG